MSNEEIDPLVAQTIEGRPRYAFMNRLPDPSETKEQKKAIAAENRTARRIKRLLRIIMQAESTNVANGQQPLVSLTIDNIKQKYGFMFTQFIRAFVEDVYRIGAKDALRFDDVAIDYYTTHQDIQIIEDWTTDSLNKVFARLEQALERDLDFNFVIDSVAAEISTFVLMQSFKAKTEQFLEFVRNQSTNDVKFAQAAKGNPQTYQGLPKDGSTIMFLLNLKGISEVNEMEAFAALRDEDGNLLNEVADITTLKDRHYFVWVTARDDKVCKQYCRPLNGIMWNYDDIGLIPLPDMLTHPRCRCMIMKVRI